LSTSTLIKDTTKDTRNCTSIDIETIAKTTVTETTWAKHVNVIVATTVNRTTATTNVRDEDGINETIATTGNPGNRTIAKMNDHAVSLLQDRVIILAL
jgi:methylaspartate ammonia-lyase